MIALNKFGLKEWEFFSQESSNVNKVKFLKNPLGMYVLKVISISQKIFEQTVALEQSLHKRGVPIPRRYKTLEGSYIVCEEDCNYTLQEYIISVSWCGEDSQITGLAKALRYFHDATTGMEINLPMGNVFENCIKLAVNSESELRQKYPENIMNNWQDIVNWIIKRVQSNYETARILDYGHYRQPIHGDYHPLNALYDKGGTVVGIIDLDQACQDDPLNDFLRALLHIYPFDFKYPLPLKIDKNFAKQKWSLFVEAYGSCILNRKCTVQMIETITLELILLYYLRGIQKNANIEQVEDWVEQAKSAFLELYMLEASSVH